MRDADVAAGAGRVRGLPRGLGGADAIQGRVRADAAGPAEHHAYAGMFLTAAVLGVPLTVAAAVGRARYRN
ncbi:hypothetical protein Shyhy01_28400 [Streptomyces hygroscopicus subsp. hygroscopicus]|nr:hypothetical protein Shyhy01_28400 [Streptomyces hygroscopicus subsp. hygroscopicus]